MEQQCLHASVVGLALPASAVPEEDDWLVSSDGVPCVERPIQRISHYHKTTAHSVSAPAALQVATIAALAAQAKQASQINSSDEGESNSTLRSMVEALSAELVSHLVLVGQTALQA